MDDIIELTHRLSCELMMADPQTPESVSALLPILKNIHFKCMKSGLKPQAKMILSCRELIGKILDTATADKQDRLQEIEAVIAAFTSQIHDDTENARPENDDPSPPAQYDAGEPPSGQAGPEPACEQIPAEPPQAPDILDRLAEKVLEFRRFLAGYCYDESDDIRHFTGNIEELSRLSRDIEPDAFHLVTIACQNYVTAMEQQAPLDLRPLEEALLLLSSMVAHLKRGEPFTFDYSDVLDLLALKFEKKEVPASNGKSAVQPADDTEQAPCDLTSDDLEILTDFVSEAEDNLDTIEVRLVDLEQDPDNTDIINDIFRPFHTIKGVAGFLSLTKINHLAHTTENLLDSARSGKLHIDHHTTDAILKAVDTLKELIDRVKISTATGRMTPDDDIDIERLTQHLKSLQDGSPPQDMGTAIGEILVKNKVVDSRQIQTALETQQSAPGKKIGEILVEEQNISPGQLSLALKEQNQIRRAKDNQVKVSTQKLDDLVDYAGELVIAQSMLKQKARSDPDLNQAVGQLGLIVTKMQNIAMSMRMIPIKATFMKMIRLVRDLSRKSGKQVNLDMSGEDTEIDRNVVDALYEPMVHMIRNSVDHGIEPAGGRKDAGKPEQGTINLRAFHKGGHIIIEIEDDGKGLDRERILEKACAMQLISGDEQMTDTQVFDLIMAPGFSTARKITDVSGRGVGMDVVKDGIEKFRGHLSIESHKGQGTKFTISLPLTLAVIDGMLIRVDHEKYVIPTIAIKRAFKPGPDQYFTVEAKAEMVEDNGELIPLIRVDELYGTGSGKKNVHDGLVVVVESKDEKRALLIDELLGKDEFVIKSLGAGMEEVPGLAGGAILGDGRVGLILDIHGIFSIVSSHDMVSE